jgi:hypothetical protein
MVKTKNSMPSGKSKVKSESAGIGAKGGSTKMFGKSDAAPQVPGMSNRPSLAPTDKGAAKGGRTGVMGKQRGASASQPGKVSVGPGSGSDNSFKVSGGKGHMAGFSPAANAKPI